MSNNWNKNDDVFCSAEIWNSRNTPISKPSNLGHDESKIVGHINKVWGLNNEGDVISDNTTTRLLPELFHLACGSVIYTAYSSDKLVNQTNELIAEIESGEKFVSMECIFSDFSYAVGSNGDYQIIERNDTSAFLSKHLRAYGGEGKYKGKTIGRLLKNITFVGKGYVDKPANPESIILSS